MQVTRSTQFNTDIELAEQQGRDMSIMEDVIRILAAGDVPPEEKHPIYPCSGPSFVRSYKTLFLQPDWVLVYKPSEDELYCSRTGTPDVAP